MSAEYRISFKEAELLQALVRTAIEGLKRMEKMGALDAVAVAEFMGAGGVEMDAVEENDFQEVIRERRADYEELQIKLKRVFGI